MSEIQDAAQVIRVSMEGMEIIMRLGKTNLDFVKGVAAVFRQVLEKEKLSGKTSVKQLLKNGGDLQVFKFPSENLAAVKKMANKYGILYSILPDLNQSDGMSEILFHSQAAPRIQSIMEQIQNSKIESMDDYFANAEPERMEKAVREVQETYPEDMKAVTHTKQQEIRQFWEEIQNNPDVNGITIDRKMVVDETAESIKTRIPYKKNEYIWLKKSEITWINEDQTIYTGLEKEKNYEILDNANQPVRKVAGQQLYEQSYDPVIRQRIGRQQRRKKKKEEDYQQIRKALESTGRTLGREKGR